MQQRVRVASGRVFAMPDAPQKIIKPSDGSFIVDDESAYIAARLAAGDIEFLPKAKPVPAAKKEAK